MTEVLVDSSAWIEYLRRGKGPAFDLLEGLLDEDRVVICGMVELELLQGVLHRERRMLKDLLQALPFIETEREDFVLAGERLGQLRRKGVIIPASDGLIGMMCLRRGLSLLTLDHHFDHLHDVKQIKV